jgi:hypothetical protein
MVTEPRNDITADNFGNCIKGNPAATIQELHRRAEGKDLAETARAILEESDTLGNEEIDELLEELKGVIRTVIEMQRIYRIGA